MIWGEREKAGSAGRVATAYRTLTSVTLRLFDTGSRAVREFRPVTRGKAAVYLCGATVQGTPHLGHLRSATCFDILVRWLETSGYQVTYCRNSTDIDDKILGAAAAEGIPWWALAERNRREFAAAYRLLGCRPADAEPRATGHIPDMIALIERLLASGHAYLAGDDVCLSVGAAPGYGTLSGRRPEVMLAAEDAGHPARKQDPRDFVLWKAAKPGEPSWQAPWGRGRPGWHIECSAMAAGYLGPAFDIHGGGQELIFPHHENVRAQSLSAGDDFARYWVHHGLVTVGDMKMSKTAGNAVAAADALRRVRPQELRYYLGQAHYRSTIDYSPGALEDAAAAYQRIERFVGRAQHVAGPAGPSPSAPSSLPISFTAAMDDDLAVSAALAAVHATVRDGNYALSTGNLGNAATCLAQVRAMLAVLGLDPLAPAWQAGDADRRLRAMVDALVGLALGQRAAARARGDYAAADLIRDTLEDTGVMVEDTREGPRWELAR
jgi:cysteinyl-tRNA synthetase